MHMISPLIIFSDCDTSGRLENLLKLPKSKLKCAYQEALLMETS